MKNRINLSNFNIRTDLIIDHKIEEKYTTTNIINEYLKVTTIEIDNPLSKELQKKEGTYNLQT